MGSPWKARGRAGPVEAATLLLLALAGACAEDGAEPREAGASGETGGDGAAERGVPDAPADTAPADTDATDGGDGPASSGRRPPLFHPVRYVPGRPLQPEIWQSTQVVVVGDVTGDGRADVVTVHDGSTAINGPGAIVSLYVQSATGTLAPIEPRSLGIADRFSKPTAALILDIDGNGRPDLLVAHPEGLTAFQAIEANDLGPAQLIAPRTTAGTPNLLAAGHFNGDRLLDVVGGASITGADPNLQLYTQRPEGGLAPPIGLAVGRGFPGALAVGDLDRDGRDDIVVSASALTARLQLSPGNWSEPRSTNLPDAPVARGGLLVGDVTDDGRDDVVVPYGDRAGWVAVVRASSDGAMLEAPALTPVDFRPSGSCLADLDGDGRKDLVLLHASKGVGVLLQKPGGGLEPEDHYRTEAHVDYIVAVPLACGDVNGDGRPDVVVTRARGLQLLLNAGDTTARRDCGAPGQPCCPGAACNQDAVCGALDMCETCGGAAEACCKGDICTQAGISCFVSTLAPPRCAVSCPTGGGPCLGCGGRGQICCNTGARCTDQGTVCAGLPGQQGFCLPCGGPGQPCCPGATCSAGGCCHRGLCVQPGSACGRDADHAGVCQDSVCRGCGGEGQPCCQPQPTSQPQSRFGTCTAPTLGCQFQDRLGTPDVTFCAACGGPGQTCCPGNVCAGGGCCEDRICLAAGQACKDGGTCQAGSCGACGGADQPCCTYLRCTAPGTVCRIPPGGPSTLCLPCGAKGQPCCAASCNHPLSCERGSCE